MASRKGMSVSMNVEDLARLVDCADCADSAERLGIPTRAAVAELARAGEIDQLLLLVTGQELHRLYVRVLRWQEDGCPRERPLAAEEICRIQARGHGACLCEGVPSPTFIAESYRAFLLWYGRKIIAS
jgi:hypothetical protein